MSSPVRAAPRRSPLLEGLPDRVPVDDPECEGHVRGRDRLVGSGGTSARSGSDPSDQATNARGTGLLGVNRRASTPPRRPPMPRRSGSRRRPRQAPRCDQRARTTRIPMPALTTAAPKPTLSHTCDQASRAPSSKSATKRWRGEGSRGFNRSRARKTALATGSPSRRRRPSRARRRPPGCRTEQARRCTQSPRRPSATHWPAAAVRR